jgi:predicted dehydrogenase
MVNAAIIGLGWWGKRLVEAARAVDAPIKFTRGVTLEPDSIRDFAAANKIEIGTSYEDVLADKSIEAVLLATPHSKHRAQVEAAAAAGKHIYCEKPFALAKADAEAMLAACARAGVVIGVGHHFRLMPSLCALRALCAEGALGTIMHVDGNYSHDWLAATPVDNWRSAPEESRAGSMTSMGIHVLDCFRDLIGPMRRIAALSTRRTLPLPSGDTSSALIEFANGATGTLATTLKTPFVWRLAVYGADAWAESASETRLIVRRAGKEPEIRDLPPDNHLGRNVEAFANAVLGRGTFPIDPAGILQTVAALEAVFKSVDARGAWQDV